MYKMVITLCIFLFTFSVDGQMVNDFNYHLMLQKKLKHNATKIDIKEVNKDTSILFIDARELIEYNVSHIKNALHVGFKNFSIDKLNGIAKNKKIVVYCSVGYRSEKIAAILKKKGFNNCYNLYGGIFEWVNQNHPVYDIDNNVTNKVHVYNTSWSIWLNKGEKIYK